MAEKAEKKEEKKSCDNFEDFLFVEKPIRKPDARIYGRLEKWEGSDFQQFVPVATGSGRKREVINSKGRAKLVKNDGEKDFSYSIYASVDGDEKDFADKLYEEVSSVLKDHVKKEIKIPSAKFIHDEESFKVWFSRERKSLAVHVELPYNAERAIMSKEWGRISYEVNKLIFNAKIKKK